MRTIARHAGFGIVVMMVLAGGCLGGSAGLATESPVPTSSSPSATPSSPTPTSTDRPPTDTPTRTATVTGTATGITSIPAPSSCLTDAVPRPSTIDSVDPSPYPEPPRNVTREQLLGWAQRFEIAYFRNSMLIEESGDDDYNLTRVSAYAELRDVEHTPGRYVLRFSNSGARTYASGLHADLWMAVGYVINDTHVVRVPLDDEDKPVRAVQGQVVLACA